MYTWIYNMNNAMKKNTEIESGQAGDFFKIIFKILIVVK